MLTHEIVSAESRNSIEKSDLIKLYFRLESLCNTDNGKVRLRMGDMAATFQLNSSLVPGQVFNCHLELALDSSNSGKFSKSCL